MIRHLRDIRRSTDGQTDGQTDGPTEKAGCRVAEGSPDSNYRFGFNANSVGDGDCTVRVYYH